MVMDEQDDRGGAVFKIKSPFFNGLSHLVGPCWINFLRWGMGKMVVSRVCRDMNICNKVQKKINLFLDTRNII